MEPWSEYLTAFASGLRDLAVTDSQGRVLAPADGFRRWVQMTREVHDLARYVYFIGNGGSAMMASHIAADACKNGQ
jgi:D-sedoheptulose 7-phosphate isomerase